MLAWCDLQYGKPTATISQTIGEVDYPSCNQGRAVMITSQEEKSALQRRNNSFTIQLLRYRRLKLS